MMMKNVNYLLGRAERLVKKINPPKMKPEKKHPYSFDRAQSRIVPRAIAAAKDIAAIPAAACPQDEAVAVLTLHPAYLAKSYFPNALLSETDLRAIGSR